MSMIGILLAKIIRKINGQPIVILLLALVGVLISIVYSGPIDVTKCVAHRSTCTKGRGK
jgi:hypothetical protein